jgi:hypothetical protein
VTGAVKFNSNRPWSSVNVAYCSLSEYTMARPSGSRVTLLNTMPLTKVLDASTAC